MKKTILLLLCAALCFPICAYAGGSGADISPAIDWLRRNTGLSKSGIAGNAIAFSYDDCAAVTGADVGYVTVSKLPDAASGKLTLNGADVIEGQTVTASSMQHLTFTPNSGIKRASFTVRCAADGWENTDIDCELYFSETANGAPTVASATAETVSGVCCVLSPEVYDPDGDDAEIDIVSYPQGGMVKVSGGRLVYMPSDGFFGTDSFTVCASDKFGNTSPQAVLTVNVEANGSGIRFADMKDSEAHAAAVMLAERSVVAFTVTDGQYYFAPAEKVSRIDFIVMLMTAAGTGTDTGIETVLPFGDTGSVPAAKLAYLKKAADMGIIKLGGASFTPDSPVTRAAAAEWICRLLGMGMKKPATVTDMASYTEDERFYAGAAVESGVFVIYDGKFMPSAELTKADTAMALKRVMDLLK